MPRAVRVAVVTARVMTLLGIASIVILTIDLLTGGSVTAALGSRAFRYLVNPLYLAAASIAVPVTVVRRDGRIRERSFHLALLFAMLLGFAALFSLVAALMVGLYAELTVSLAVFVLTAVLALSLSRASAKAWFSSRVG